MEHESPPKRVTRARAAAKTKMTEPDVQIATAAAKAKATQTMPIPATRRRTRADVGSHGEGMAEESVTHQAEKPTVTRGRPTRTQVIRPEPGNAAPDEGSVMAAPPKTTRGRPKRLVLDEPAALEPARSTRGRARKAEATQEVMTEQAPEPVRKVTRGRAVASEKLNSRPKKSVKFEDSHTLDKENILPLASARGAKKDAIQATGIRAKPIRKPAPVTRVTRGRAKEPEPSKGTSPLSPKKAKQIAVAKDSGSDDELATMEKTPMRPLTKSPIKAPIAALGENKKLDFSSSIVVNRAAPDSIQDSGASLMASPARRPPHSPYKEGLRTSPQRAVGESLLRSPMKPPFVAPTAATTSPLKVSLLQSPAKRPNLPTKVSDSGSPTATKFKMSFLQSPAKRPISPTKATTNVSPDKAEDSTIPLGATPKPSTFSVSRLSTPRTLHKNAFRPGKGSLSMMARPATETRKPSNDYAELDSIFVKPFPGRLSAILPRHADPAMSEGAFYPVHREPQAAQANTQMIAENEESSLDPDTVESMDVDEKLSAATGGSRSTTPTQSPPRHSAGSLNSPSNHQDPFQDSESEDELASALSKYSPAPLSTYKISSKDFAIALTARPSNAAIRPPATFQTNTRNGSSPTSSHSTTAREHGEEISFTPLASHLDDKMATSPSSSGSTGSDGAVEEQRSPVTASLGDHASVDTGEDEQDPSQSTFFDDEMSIRDEIAASVDPDVIDALEFAPAELDDEDVALATEADEMSVVEGGPPTGTDDEGAAPITETNEVPLVLSDEMDQFVRVPDDSVSGAGERALSEASQEYGDENALPADLSMHIDPTLLASDPPAQQQPLLPTDKTFVTPRRVLSERVFHTVSKIALKPAADSSPGNAKRSRTVKKLPTQRHASVPPIASSPTDGVGSNLTIAESTSWSSAATPARTPRKELNDQVLKGAVVFVDVHTSEGADASAVFVELLGWMGARCVKSWNWKSNGDSHNEDPQHTAGAKVGITHVVFKDGGKRTLEKVRESEGIVLCVGVGWVLDCERHNFWLDEAPYAIDTALVPRGGHRRRKSMEPRALANMNGTLTPLPTASVAPRAASFTFGPTKGSMGSPEILGTDMTIGRRKSTTWVRSPVSDEDNNSVGDDTMILSPVPPTPAPATISAYAENILDGDVEMTPYFPDKCSGMHNLMQMTAPPKRAGRDEFGNLGATDAPPGSGNKGGAEKGALMQRLLLARRKSLQWAPKVGSPLAKGTSYGGL
ncbi:MAG: hypothetical protein M1818_002943 [Claussenomyces sp. TS43310]|nr:MAG: hypothetical protein M1818_002943 [Claussenomyces sp. TS43310]